MIQKMVETKKPPIPFVALAEICVEEGNIPLGVGAMRRIPDVDDRIGMLI